MKGAPRSSKKSVLLVLATLLALLLVGQGQASAQGSASASPDASQYGDSSSQAMDAADIPPTVSDNVDDGTGSVNDAMTDRGASPAEASAAGASPAGASPSASPGGEGMTVLPETGGASSPAPVLALCAGVLLLVCGLSLLRSSLHGG